MSEINKPNGNGISRVFKAAYCSIKGFKAAFQHEAAFRQEVILSAVLLPTIYWLAQSSLHALFMAFCIAFLLFAEIINSALEALADKITLEHDELIGRAKDLGSSGVFIAMTFLKLVWLEAIYQWWIQV